MSIQKKFKSFDDVLEKSASNMFFNEHSTMFIELASFMFSMKNSICFLEKLKPDLCKWVVESTPKLNDNSFAYSLSTRVHWVFMGFNDFPKCANPECSNCIGKNMNVLWQRGYANYCSLKCGTRCSREKSNATLHKHASENPSFFYDVEQKKKNTRLQSHGDPNWNNRSKAEKTCLDRYGVAHPIANEDVFNKSMKTRLERYGEGNLTNYKKIAETCMERYGHRSVWGNPDIHRRCIDKTIELYGSPNPGCKYCFDRLMFDSKPELAYYIWLRNNSIDFTFKPSISFSYEVAGQKHRYFPDFIVEGQVVEIKGDHFFKEDGTMQNPFDHSQDELYEAKHQCMIANDVKILCQDEYNEFIRYVVDAYGVNFFYEVKCEK